MKNTKDEESDSEEYIYEEEISSSESDVDDETHNETHNKNNTINRGRGIQIENTDGVRRKYRLQRDVVDANDPLFNVHYFSIPRAPLPKKVDLRKGMPKVYNQGTLGSCTANAIGCAYQYDQIKQKSKDIIRPSRLFIYYNERKMEHHINRDSGASLASGIISVHTHGVCSEKDWPYIISKFKVEPPQHLYKNAQHHKTGKYKRISQNLQQLKVGLNSGIPIVFGMLIFKSFEGPIVSRTGYVYMPRKGEDCLGGHAVTICGYDDDERTFIVRNSWGNRWGDRGYFYLPYDYVTNPQLCMDFWSILNVIDK